LNGRPVQVDLVSLLDAREKIGRRRKDKVELAVGLPVGIEMFEKDERD